MALLKNNLMALSGVLYLYSWLFVFRKMFRVGGSRNGCEECSVDNGKKDSGLGLGLSRFE